jgi:putative membrane protein
MNGNGLKWKLAGAAMVLLPVTLAAQNPGQTPVQQTVAPGAVGSPNTPGSSSASPSPFGQDTTPNSIAGPDVGLMQDKIFLRKATEGGYAEIQFGQLAAQKATDDSIKKYGQRMAADHTTLNSEIKPLAEQVGVRSPTKLAKDDQEQYDKLAALSGQDFDRAYLVFVVQDHRKDLRDFRTEEASTANPDLKDTVARGEQVILEHLKMGAQLAKANGVVVLRSSSPSH